VTRPIYDPKDPTSRGRQIQDHVTELLEAAAVERAKLGPTFEEKALAKSLEGLTVPMPKAKP
jgi:hypothetical protein